MTKEEAIQALAGLLSEYCSDCPMIYEENCDCEARESIDMAINSLSAEPSLKAIKKQIDEHWYLDKNDLISRAEVIDTFKKFYSDMGVNMVGVWNKQLVEIIKEEDIDDTRLKLKKLWENLKALPPADRPKGEWIEVFDFVHLAWECSECGAITSVMTPFCYECGADMRGGKDD